MENNALQVDYSNWEAGKQYPEWMDEIAVSMISKGYLLPDEDVFDAYKRVSKSAARRLRRKDLQPIFYEAIVKNWLCLASPVLSNMGTERGMPISCFGIDVGDSIEGIAGLDQFSGIEIRRQVFSWTENLIAERLHQSISQ